MKEREFLEIKPITEGIEQRDKGHPRKGKRKFK
jgi:hypothetical protein